MRSQLEVTEMLECKPYCVAPSFQRNTLLQEEVYYKFIRGGQMQPQLVI